MDNLLEMEMNITNMLDNITFLGGPPLKTMVKGVGIVESFNLIEIFTEHLSFKAAKKNIENKKFPLMQIL